MAKLSINELNEFFEELEIESTKCKGKEFYKSNPYSVSKIIETLKTPFEKEKVAESLSQKYKNDLTHKYGGKEPWEIIEMWDTKAEIARNTGKMLDDYIGGILTGDNESSNLIYTSEDANLYNRRERFDNFNTLYNEVLIPNNFKYSCRELVLCMHTIGIQGRFDAIFLKDDKICLFDWKSNETISTTNSYKNMLGPLYKYPETDLNGYSIQLYIYKYILRKRYNIENEIIPCLCRLGPDKFEIYNHEIEYSDELIESIFRYALEKIKNK